MTYYYTSELCHHGIKGQQWGVRRFRNEDGSLTLAGKERYGNTSQKRKVLYEFGPNPSAYDYEKAYAKRDAYREKQSKGKEIAKSILMRASSRSVYDLARSNGETRGKAAARALFNLDLSDLAGTTVLSVFNAPAFSLKVFGNKNTAAALTEAAGIAASRFTNKKVSDIFEQNNRASGLQQRALVQRYITKKSQRYDRRS